MPVYKYVFNPITGVMDKVYDVSLLVIRGAVDTTGDLPLTGNTHGDLYVVKNAEVPDDNQLFTWNKDASSGLLTDWDEIGSIAAIDWSNITNKPTSDVADIDDAVSKRHTQNSDTQLGTMAANINMNSKKLINLAVPSSNGDSIRATTKITEANLESAIDSIHAAVSVAGAPLTLSTQEITFNYNSDHFDLNGDDLQIKADAIDDTLIDWGLGANQVAADNIPIAIKGTPTYTTIQDIIKTQMSIGQISGGVISDAGSETVNITGGTGNIRETNSHVGILDSFDWAASNGVSIPTNTVRFIGVEYAATPAIVVKETDTWNRHTEFALGTVVNEAGTLHIYNNPEQTANGVMHIIHRLYEVEGLQRANRLGGLILGETGSRYVTLSEGELYDRVNEFSITAIDTTPTGNTFDSYSSNGQESTGDTQWDNDNYDNAGTLTTLGSNKYANLWFYLETDGALICVYGTAQYTSLAGAESESPPTVLPDRITYTAMLIGRILFQKGDSTAQEIQTVFDTTFNATSASDHNNLASLQGGTVAEYYHLTASEHTELNAWLDDVTLGSDGAITLPTNIGMYFRDAAIYINSDDDGNLDLHADSQIHLNAYSIFSDNVSIMATKKLYFDGGGNTYILEPSTDVLDFYVGGVKAISITEDTTANITISDNLILALDKQIRFGDAAVHIQSDDDGHLDLTADTSIDLNALIINFGTNGANIVLNFDGATNDGVITWQTAENVFKFSNGIIMDTAIPVYFRDGAINIASLDDGHLDLTADTSIDLNGLVELPTGQLKFPATANLSADANTLDDYEEYIAASTACTGAVTATVSWKLTKIGNTVILTLPSTYSNGVALTSFVYGVAIPAAYRPAENLSFPVRMHDNGADLTLPGMIIINTVGAITGFKDLAGSGTFTVTANAGMESTSFSWVV